MMWMLYSMMVLIMMTTNNVILCFLKSESYENLVTYLEPNETFVQDMLSLVETLYSSNQIQIFCQREQPLRPWNIFQSNYIRLEIEGDANYQQYRAATANDVRKAYEENREIYDGKLLAKGQTVRRVVMPVHAHSCYGLFTNHVYNVTLVEEPFDEDRIAQFLLGLVLYATAPLLGEQLFCCYASAVALGAYLAGVCVVCAAHLCSGEAGLMHWQHTQDNFKLVLMQQPSLVALALVGGAWIMQNTCQNHRELWLLPWVRSAHVKLLRFVASYITYSASDHFMFSAVTVALLLGYPHLWLMKQSAQMHIVKARRWLAPPEPRRLIGTEEFDAQREFETQRALGQLRNEVLSNHPPWQWVAQLQEPQRFAQFVQGGSHVTPREERYGMSRFDNNFPSQTGPQRHPYAHSSSFNTAGSPIRHSTCRECPCGASPTAPTAPPPNSPSYLKQSNSLVHPFGGGDWDNEDDIDSLFHNRHFENSSSFSTSTPRH